MKTNKLNNPNFILIVIGQIISLLGNGILRFALPLHLLKETGSSAIFGIVGALSFLPLIILMPIGGIIADRLNKRNIMVLLDFMTGVLMIVLYLLLGKVDIFSLLMIVLMILYSITGLYQPTVQASIPVLLDDSILMKGNGIISSIGALSNLLSPVIGGFVFGIYGIYPIILVSMICFFVSAFFEMFIKIPQDKKVVEKSLIESIKSDISISFNFVVKEKPIIIKIVLLAAILNAFVSAMLIIAMPVLITERLNLSEELYGISQGALALGGLLGGVFIGIFGGKLKVEKTYKIFLLVGISLIPICIAPMFSHIVMVSYSLILISSFFVMITATVTSIQIMTYVQKQTPENIIGKVMALFLTLAISSQPIGQIFYGLAFEYYIGKESLIILVSIIVSLLISIYSKKFLK